MSNSTQKFIKKISFGEKTRDKQAVFVAFVCPNGKPYENYGISEIDKNKDVFTIFMLARWDGKIGFPGGIVDGDESLEDAAIREVKEEIFFTLKKEEITPVCSHEFSINTHLFAVELTWHQMKVLAFNALKAEHAFAETCGPILFQVHKKSLPNILKQNFASSVREEMDILLQKYKIQEAIAKDFNKCDWCNGTGEVDPGTIHHNVCDVCDGTKVKPKK